MNELSVLVGIDLVEIEEIRHALLKFGERFLNRIFEQEELDFYLGKGEKRFQEGVAALFASKEAVKKLFLQREEQIGWRAIRVLHTSSGKPVVRLCSPFDERFQHVSLSISHSRSTVVAVAVAWGEV
ncbi:MAG: holo-ACP synthase [Candidatus Atribacteria bacterium]|nr:holo-ACP synthase [Candidatus Atribacteria bacterium]